MASPLYSVDPATREILIDGVPQSGTQRSPISVPDPEAQASAENSQALQQQDSRQEDPATSWFVAGPMAPDVFDYHKQLGSIDDFEIEFAKGFSRYKPKTVEDYVALGDRFIQQAPELAPYMKNRMLETMPPQIKADYEARLAKAKAMQAFKEQQQMIKWQNQELNKDAPSGYQYDTQGKLQPVYKPELDKFTAAAGVIDRIGKIDDQMRVTEDPSSLKVMQQTRQTLIQLLGDLSGGSPEAQQSTPQELNIPQERVQMLMAGAGMSEKDARTYYAMMNDPEVPEAQKAAVSAQIQSRFKANPQPQ